MLVGNDLSGAAKAVEQAPDVPKAALSEMANRIDKRSRMEK